MILRILIGVLGLGLLWCPGVAVAYPLQINTPAPLFAAFDSRGQVHRLQDYRGKIIVLEWTSHQCPYTSKFYSAGSAQALQKSATANDIVWFSLISAGPGEQGYADADLANQVAARTGAAPTAILLDPKGYIGRKYNAKVTPQFYILDRDGKIAYMGAADSNPSARWGKRKPQNFVMDALNNLLDGVPVMRPVTRPYGCAIKYAPMTEEEGAMERPASDTVSDQMPPARN